MMCFGLNDNNKVVLITRNGVEEICNDRHCLGKVHIHCNNQNCCYGPSEKRELCSKTVQTKNLNKKIV